MFLVSAESLFAKFIFLGMVKCIANGIFMETEDSLQIQRNLVSKNTKMLFTLVRYCYFCRCI